MTERYPIVTGTTTSDPGFSENLYLQLDESEEQVRVHYTEAVFGRTMIISIHIPEDELSEAFYPKGEAMYIHQIVGVILASFIEHFEGLEHLNWEYRDHSVTDASTTMLDKGEYGEIKGLHTFVNRELQIVFRESRT